MFHSLVFTKKVPYFTIFVLHQLMNFVKTQPNFLLVRRIARTSFTQNCVNQKSIQGTGKNITNSTSAVQLPLAYSRGGSCTCNPYGFSPFTLKAVIVKFLLQKIRPLFVDLLRIPNSKEFLRTSRLTSRTPVEEGCDTPGKQHHPPVKHFLTSMIAIPS